jgi:hypothetical protein
MMIFNAPEEKEKPVSLKNLNECHRNVYDGNARQGRLVAELPAGRYSIESKDGLHRVYDTQPAEGESHPLGDMAQHPLSEQETKDRAAVNDAALSMPIRLAALNRINAKRIKK